MSHDEERPGKTEPVAPDVCERVPDDPSRRRALRKLGGYAISVAPAMLLLTPGAASAQGRGNGGGNGGGAGGGSIQGAGGSGPDCTNPAWELGLQRSGHSGC